MNTLLRLFAAALLAVLIAAPAAHAQRGFSLDDLDGLFNEEALVEVNLRGALLRLVAEASRADEPEFAAIVDGLRGVFVRQYPLSSARSGVDGRIRDFGRALERDGWETLVRARDPEEGEDVYIYVLTEGDFFDGLVVMALNEDDNEATFVTFEGRIDPAEVGRLGGRFGVDELNGASR